MFGQGPGEALLTGCAYAGIELAIDKLHAARMLDPVARLALAKVTFKYETPTRAIAISSKMLPGL